MFFIFYFLLKTSRMTLPRQYWHVILIKKKTAIENVWYQKYYLDIYRCFKKRLDKINLEEKKDKVNLREKKDIFIVKRCSFSIFSSILLTFTRYDVISSHVFFAGALKFRFFSILHNPATCMKKYKYFPRKGKFLLCSSPFSFKRNRIYESKLLGFETF